MKKTELPGGNEGALVELVVLAPGEGTARCRIPGTKPGVTLRSEEAWDMVSGEIVVIRVERRWSQAGHPHLSGEVESHRLDVEALSLVPLRLQDEWLWHPEEHYWGEEHEPLEEWARRILAAGARPSFEMEQVVPGADPVAWEGDPILEACDLDVAGHRSHARRKLVELLAADLRCLDAHAHLGNFAFDDDPAKAVRHYEVGVRIGELSLGDDFDGLLPWGRIDNRPFLRSMHGFGLCLWRLDRLDEAAAVFDRMLWLNPTDNQGVRFLLPDVHAGERWEDHYPPTLG